MFKISDHVEFNSNGRAVCPSCELDGKGKNQNLSLVPGSDGAYKCFRGCKPEDIRSALGQEKSSNQIPTALAQPQRTSTSVSPQRIAADHKQLLNNSTKAVEWLHQRGINREAIKAYKLGVSRSKVGDRHLPSISIPLPNRSGTAYWRKKRVAPWLSKSEQPDEYQAWSQYQIPQQVFFTHQPENAKQTYLCEGEWDAIRLGWEMRDAEYTAVACFTCGCSASPSVEELDRLPGDVIIFYDLDEPGKKGAQKLAERLGKRAKIATVPAPEDRLDGWDISDALNYTDLETIQAAANAAASWKPPAKVSQLRQRIISNDELMARAPDYIDWLIPDVLTPNELFILGMPPRGGKSLFCMTLAKAIAEGGKFLDRPVTQGAVLYINLEDGESKIKTRQIAQGWAKGLPVYWLDKFKLNELSDLAEAIDDYENLRLIVIDTFSRARSDGSKETGAEMGQVLEPLQELAKEKNVCILMTHHLSKGTLEEGQNPFDLLRGSGAIRATARGAMVIIPGEGAYRLISENGHSENLDLRIRIQPETLEWRLLGNWQPRVDGDMKTQILDHLNLVGQATVTEIAEALNFKASSVSTTLYRLQADDMLAKTGGKGRSPAVYMRSANLSQQLDVLLGHQDVDSVKSVALSQQKTLSTDLVPKLINMAKPDQKIDQDDQVSALIDNCWDKPAEPCAASGVVSQQADPLLGQDGTNNCHTPKPAIAVQSKVYYTGGNMATLRVCGRKKLTVESIEDGIATVSHAKWQVTQSIDVTELEVAQ